MEAAQSTNIIKSMMCQDILLSVLSLLPPEVSARSKLVCSYWNRVISGSSYLQSLHKCCADSKRVVIFYHSSAVLEYLLFGKYSCEDNVLHALSSGVFEDESNYLETFGYSISATCNGFFLLENMDELALRNPLTKTDVCILSLPDYHPRRHLARLIYCGLDISSSSEHAGKIELVFTIMRIYIGRGLGGPLCCMYSSLTSSWTLVEMDDMVFKQLISPQDSSLRLRRAGRVSYPDLNPVGAAFLRRSMHWLVEDGRILAFDLERRMWQYMETPASRGKQGLIKNHSDIISATIESWPLTQWHALEPEVELISKLSYYLYPNVWFGSLGEHIYICWLLTKQICNFGCLTIMKRSSGG